MEEKVFIPFSSRYDDIDNETIFGDKSFLGFEDNNLITNEETFLESFSIWVAYYRMFPHKFIEDYFGIKLKPFQIYIMYMIFKKPNSMLIGTRGIGKTFIVALTAISYAILYPSTKIVVLAGIQKQAFQTLVKIKEIRDMSKTDMLTFEFDGDMIESVNTVKNNVTLKNGSYIKVTPANDGARGLRSNFTILDEFRMIDAIIYQSVIKRLSASPRTPHYLSLPQYSHLKPDKRNKQVFLSSAYYMHHWAYDKYVTFMKNMCKNGENSTYGLATFSYETSIMNDLLSKEELLEELEEEGFDFATFAMELKSHWSGQISNGYYTYDKLTECRMLEKADYPLDILNQLGYKPQRQPRKNGEIRILVADIALMGGKKNDNTAIGYISAYPNESNQYYIRELRYMETIAGGIQIGYHSSRIRQLYQDFDCDYLVLDTNGIGMQVYGDLVRELKSHNSNIVYEPLGCMNDPTMQVLCSDQTAPKVIYSIKANSELNKLMNTDLQSKVIRKRLRLLVEEMVADQTLSEDKNYSNWRKGNGELFKLVKNPYKQTTLLINEMINLELTDATSVKLKEQSGKVKDRFSCVAMGNYFISQELESKLINNKFSGWGAYRASSSANGYKKTN